MASEERLRELEEKYEGYTVYDNAGSKIGKVDDLFVDEKDHEEYIGVKMGFLGMKSTLIPTEVVRVNESDRTIEVSESKDHVKNAPSFDDDEDVTAEYEERIRRHFGLESLQGSSDRGSYGAAGAGAAGTAAASGERGTTDDTGSSGYAPGDTETGRRDDSYGGGDTGSSETYRDDRDRGSGATGSGVDTEYGERGESGTSSGEYRETDETSTATSGAATGGSVAGSSSGDYESSGTSDVPGGTSTGSSGSQPTTSRQTEETETFQEGGRTKIRRRIIREEVVDADDQ